MGAPKGNTNASKDNKSDAVLYLRVSQSDRNRWIRQAQKEDKKLRDWVIDRLNKATN